MIKSNVYRFSLLLTCIGLFIPSFFASAQPHKTLTSSQPAGSIPAPPTDRADRFGIYNWGVDYAAYPGGNIDRLNWAADKVAEIGSRTIRLAIPGYAYGLTPGADLVQTVSDPAYDKLFSDARFKTYFLTTYSPGVFAYEVSPWADGLTSVETDATRQEIGKLGDYLLTNPRYAGKTFIIINWEGDHMMYEFANKQSIWDSFTAWIQARADGVRDARNRHPDSSAKLYSAFEFNYILNPRTGQQCGTPVSDPLKEDPLKNRCGIDYVAPRVDVDYYSYSSWLTLDVKYEGPNGSYKQAIKRDLNFALAKVRERRPEVQEANFIIGEFGIHRTRWGENTTANYVSEMFDAIEGPDAFQVSYAIYWQIIDNIPFFWVWDDGFGLYTSRHGRFEMNRIGQAFKRRISGQGPQPFIGGPLIRKTPFPGILDSIAHSSEFHLNPDSILEIYAQGCCEHTDTPFSTSGNIVRIEQGLRQYSIPRDNSAYFYESATQINASLPKGLRPGIVLVYVQDNSGVESNGPIINLMCDSCPMIANVIDSPNGINEFHPGTVITISGSRFSPSGNTVTVEQRDSTAHFYRFVIPQSAVLQESTDQITVRLPNNLIISQATAFIVTNAEGRESNEYSLFWPLDGISPECPNCAPALRVNKATLNRDTKTESFYAGAIVTIAGDRFSTNGNKVIFEQAGNRYAISQGNSWRETPTLITAQLPYELVPGRALIYVTDASGRESKAQAINIGRGIARRAPIRRDTLQGRTVR